MEIPRIHLYEIHYLLIWAAICRILSNVLTMVLLILALELKAMVSHALDQENINRNTDSWSDFDKYLLFNRYLGKAPLRLQEPMQAVPIVVEGSCGGVRGRSVARKAPFFFLGGSPKRR
uniref:Uncharacterized protein n=1 Tax=Odontella aurita TaxID=265563 RepID=A0A7S4M571_9STRA|mmetsp:Transcript_10869/g.32167  ORF Transcript_10869/g.32167 Transcript_10869/m.32167 type:complete len:119 (+) Transcript_10869:112-468(+)